MVEKVNGSLDVIQCGGVLVYGRKGLDKSVKSRSR